MSCGLISIYTQTHIHVRHTLDRLLQNDSSVIWVRSYLKKTFKESWSISSSLVRRTPFQEWTLSYYYSEQIRDQHTFQAYSIPLYGSDCLFNGTLVRYQTTGQRQLKNQRLIPHKVTKKMNTVPFLTTQEWYQTFNNSRPRTFIFHVYRRIKKSLYYLTRISSKYTGTLACLNGGRVSLKMSCTEQKSI